MWSTFIKMQLLTFSQQTCHKMGVSIVTHNADLIWNYNLLIKMRFPQPPSLGTFLFFKKNIDFATVVYFSFILKDVWKECLKIKKHHLIALLKLKTNILSTHFPYTIYILYHLLGFWLHLILELLNSFTMTVCLMPWKRDNCIKPQQLQGLTERPSWSFTYLGFLI